MLGAQNITYTIQGKNLVSDVSLCSEPGKVHLIIGPNGAGKSTLIKLFSGALRPSAGVIKYGDKTLNHHSVSELARIRAVLSQNIELSFPLTVREVVMMGRYPHFSGTPTAKDIAACRDVVSYFKIDEFADRDYTTLSGGEKQRVQFAKVLAQIWFPIDGQRRYLFLDEPLTFLDVHYQHEFMQQLTQLATDNDIVIVGVVHDLNLAAKYADRLTLLCNGSVLAGGEPSEVLTEENIRKAYGVKCKTVLIDGKKYILF